MRLIKVMNNLRAMKRLYDQRTPKPEEEEIHPFPLKTTSQPDVVLPPTTKQIPLRSAFQTLSRCLAVAYLFAFISFYSQFSLLWSSGGVQPVSQFLQNQQLIYNSETQTPFWSSFSSFDSRLPANNHFSLSDLSDTMQLVGRHPTLFWVTNLLGISVDVSDDAFAISGVLFSLLALISPKGIIFLSLWTLYLSLRSIMQGFSLQFDDLLLEVGFLLLLALPTFRSLTSASNRTSWVGTQISNATKPVVFSCLRLVVIKVLLNSALQRLVAISSDSKWWSYTGIIPLFLLLFWSFLIL
jgi:hypothetical protein